MTTTAASLGTGASAAPRAPTTTGQPALARAHSDGKCAAGTPRRSRRAASRAAQASVGTTTTTEPSPGPTVARAPSTRASGSSVGATMSVPGSTTSAPSAGAGARAGASGSSATTRAGEAAARNLARGEYHRRAAHPARSTTAGDGPRPSQRVTAFSARAASPSPTTQPRRDR